MKKTNPPHIPLPRPLPRELTPAELKEVTGGTPSIPIPPPGGLLLTPSIPIPPP